jgi:hypothetical protein
MLDGAAGDTILEPEEHVDTEDLEASLEADGALLPPEDPIIPSDSTARTAQGDPEADSALLSPAGPCTLPGSQAVTDPDAVVAQPGPPSGPPPGRGDPEDAPEDPMALLPTLDPSHLPDSTAQGDPEADSALLSPVGSCTLPGSQAVTDPDAVVAQPGPPSGPPPGRGVSPESQEAKDSKAVERFMSIVEEDADFFTTVWFRGLDSKGRELNIINKIWPEGLKAPKLNTLLDKWFPAQKERETEFATLTKCKMCGFAFLRKLCKDQQQTIFSITQEGPGVDEKPCVSLASASLLT